MIRTADSLLEMFKLLENRGAIEILNGYYLRDFVKEILIHLDSSTLDKNSLIFKCSISDYKISDLKEEIEDLKREIDRLNDKNTTINNEYENNIDILSKKILKMQNLIKDLYTEAGL